MSRSWDSWRADVARIVPLAWPVFAGQVAMVLFATVDTVLVARYSATDLAALAVGAAAYITVFIGLMGVVLAVAPIVGQLYGAKRLHAAGEQLHQAVWLALGLALPGCLLLAFPQPFLALSDASPEVAGRLRGYLLAIACALPAGLLFAAYRGFNNAVSRPKAVMVLQLSGLVIKVPLAALLVHGAGPIPALGVVGCGASTAIVMWCLVFIAWQVMRRDAFYAPFAIFGHGLKPPHWPAIASQLKLGVPMGGSVLIEVTGFASMAFFISRFGATPVAGHQIAANLVSLLFMVPMALGNATSTVAAQSVGAGALRDARRVAWHGIEFTALVALVLGTLLFFTREGVVRLYTNDEVIVAAALPLLAWVVLFHFADAMQIASAFVLRAWRIATVPLVIYATSIWGLGVGGGYALAFNLSGNVPVALHGARGFWIASTAGLAAAALGLTLFLAWVLRQQRAKERAAMPAPAG
ncbi:MAG TPA: MATE family efflux transporter [Burkholderiaceae bacterium]|nr:MATE family efflux transporter [Burkholderiaceae bacterium]